MANIEALVIDWLNTDPAIQPVRAAVSVPTGANSARPGTFITVERTGGQERMFDSTALLAVQAWAPTQLAASDLAQRIISRLKGMMRIGEVVDVDITGYTFFPTATGWPRYQIALTVQTQTDYYPTH